MQIPENAQRILVLNRNHIGDCLLTTPMLRALKRGFPRARLAVSVPEVNCELLCTNPHVDEIVIRPAIPSWAAKIRFAIQQRRASYDVIISLQEKSQFYGWTTRYVTLLNPRRPVTVALDHPRTRRHYQHVSAIAPDQHEVYKYLDIARLLGCPVDPNPVLELDPTRQARDAVAQFLAGRGYDVEARFIGLNPGGTKPAKRWSVERFAEVGDRLHHEAQLPVVIFGGQDDQELAAGIARQMRHRPLVAAGKLTLGQTAALLERCRVLITGDTGPMHMAVALAVPVVALFGPTNPVKFGPFTTQGVVLQSEEGCEDCMAPCLHTMQAEGVFQAAHRLLTQGTPRPVERLPGG